MMGLWLFLLEEADLDDALRSKAAALTDLLKRETFFRELPAIDQHTSALETEYARRYQEVMAERSAAYKKAFDRLVKTSGRAELDEDQQRRIAGPLQRGMKPAEAGCPSRRSGPNGRLAIHGSGRRLRR